MAPNNLTRQRLVEAAALLFHKKGYFNTSMSDIADACGIRKSSIYHHIPSREDLLMAVLEYGKKTCQQQMINVVNETEVRSPKKQITHITQAMRAWFIENDGICGMTSLAYELVSTVPRAEVFIKDFFNHWINAIKTILLAQYNEIQARILAEDIMAQIQGSLLISRLQNNFSPLDRSLQRLDALLKEEESIPA